MVKLTTKLFPSLTNFPFLIGFEDLWKEFDRAFDDNVNSTYPPYNIIKIDDFQFKIEMAVAGFTDNEISITLRGGDLIVEGQNTAKVEDAAYLFRGLASRSFRRQFKIRDNVKVEGADLTSGILTIRLQVPQPQKIEQTEPEKIFLDSQIKAGAKKPALFNAGVK